jgi:hypothetical protein
MTDSVRKADYFYVEVANRAGAGAAYLKALRDAGVNLLAFTGFPAGRDPRTDLQARRGKDQHNRAGRCVGR